MGSKRPRDGVDLVRQPFKHARLDDSNEKLISFSYVASWVGARHEDDVLGIVYNWKNQNLSCALT